MKLQDWMIPSDLAPGDAKSLARDWSDVELHRVEDVGSASFEMAFGALWAEFGAAGEVEQSSVLAERMQWDPAVLRDGCALRYRLMLVTSRGEFAAVRDHTAIVLEDEPGAVVHLSHNFVAPAWRRSGLAGWLRALPITTGRSVLKAQGRSEESPIILVGEMEHPDSAQPASLVRLLAYERAGYRKVDPTRVPYLQPDFRPFEQIDATGGPQPLPLTLVVRRVGNEKDDWITGSEVRRIVRSLYRMYGFAFREADMRCVFKSLDSYPDDQEKVPLLPPTWTR